MTVSPISHGFQLRPYQKSDRDWVLAAHVAHYRAVERFDPTFDLAVAQALADIDGRIGIDRTFGLVLLDQDGAPRGTGFACDTGASAKLRLFLVDRPLQGQGLGHDMLSALLDRGGQAGFRRIEVATFDAHCAACRLYLRCGFAEEARAPCLAFGRQMVRIDFALTIA